MRLGPDDKYLCWQSKYNKITVGNVTVGEKPKAFITLKELGEVTRQL